MKQEDKKEKKKASALFIHILMAIGIAGMIFIQAIGELGIGLPYEILISLAIGVGVSSVIYLLKKFNILKPKTKEEELKEKQQKEDKKEEKEDFKCFIETLNPKELQELVDQKEGEISNLKEVMDKPKNKLFTDYIWEFTEFGLVIFFLALLYFGSLNGTYIHREVYQTSINNSMAIGANAFASVSGTLFGSFEYLVMLFYDIGSSKPVLMFWFFWLGILYWIGYLYIYKILLEGSYMTIKEFIVPIIKKGIKNMKEGRKNSTEVPPSY